MSDLSLFDYPTSPPAAAEQRALALEGTLSAQYALWRLTEEGERVWRALCARALQEGRRGAARIGVKALVEEIRSSLRVEVNNSHTALLARDLVDAEPSLRGLIELRRRHTA